MSPSWTSPPTVPVTATVAARLGGVDDVVGGDRVERDRRRRRRVDRVGLRVGRRGAVAGRVGGGDAGVDRAVAIGDQIAAGHVDAEGAALPPCRCRSVPLTVRVTVSPSWTSPPTVPVTATVPPASAALTMSSAVMASSVMVAAAPSYRPYSSASSVAVVLLPAASVVVTLASTVLSASAARSLPATSMLKAPPCNQAGIGGAVDRQGDGVAVLDVAAHRAGDRNVAGRLGGVDDVVGRDGVERDGGRRAPWFDRVGLARRSPWCCCRPRRWW